MNLNFVRIRAIIKTSGLSLSDNIDSRPAILLIFDVDGTLCNTAGLGRKAFELAFEDVYAIANAAEGIRPHGRTDMWIFREILIRHNRSHNDFGNKYSRFIVRYLFYLRQEIENWQVCNLMPGVEQLLEHLHCQNNVYLALGTGNEREAAYIKLDKLNVGHYFPVGGFGSDCIDRTEIIKIAQSKSCEHYQIDFKPDNTWVIGDTPFDIICGKKNGFNTIAVATGGIDIEELKRRHASVLLEDLSDMNRFLKSVALPGKDHAPCH